MQSQLRHDYAAFTHQAFASDGMLGLLAIMKMKTVACFLVLVAALAPFPAFSATSNSVSSGDTTIRLVVAEPGEGESTVRGFLEVQLAPGWKTYWRDPGDAGVPLDLDISGSQNASDATVHYPLPKRFNDGLTVWAGYDHPVQLPFEVVRPDPAKASVIRAKVFLGICEKICIPVSAQLTATVENAAASTVDQASVGIAFSKLPAKADGENGIAAISIKGDMLSATVQLEGEEAKDLFLAAPAGWQFSAPSIVSAGVEGVQFRSKVLYAPKSGQPLPIIGYTIEGPSKAVSGQISADLF